MKVGPFLYIFIHCATFHMLIQEVWTSFWIFSLRSLRFHPLYKLLKKGFLHFHSMLCNFIKCLLMNSVVICLLMGNFLKFSYMKMRCILGVTNIIVHGSICTLKFVLSYDTFEAPYNYVITHIGPIFSMVMNVMLHAHVTTPHIYHLSNI